MDDPNTQQPFQPSYDDLKPKPKPKRTVNVDEDTRRQARTEIRAMIVEGIPDDKIIKTTRLKYDIAYTTAKKYLDTVYADIAKAKAIVAEDREYDYWMALERYKVAFAAAAKKGDIKHMIEANRRITELQGIIPEQNRGLTINNVMAGNIPNVNPDLARLSTRDLEDIVDVPHKRIEQQSVDVIPEVLTAEQAEQLLKDSDD